MVTKGSVSDFPGVNGGSSSSGGGGDRGSSGGVSGECMNVSCTEFNSSSSNQTQQDSLSAAPPDTGLPIPSQSIVPRIPFLPGLPADHMSPFYGRLSAGFDLKENVEAWRSYGPIYDSTILANYPMIRNGYGFDLNGNRRKNATRETTSTLKAWLNDHRKNPYPTKAEKIMLAIITQMTLTQVSTWFANARRRLKKENKMTWSPRNRCDDDDEDCKEDKQEESDSDIDINDNDDCPSSNKRFKRSTSPLFDSTSAAVPTPHHLSQHHFYPFIQHHHLLSLNDHHHQQQQQQQQQQTPQQQQQQNQHPQQQQQQAPSLNDPATSSENKVSSPSRIWSIVETAMTTKSNT